MLHGGKSKQYEEMMKKYGQKPQNQASPCGFSRPGRGPG
jgi:hypothetical protein